MSVFANYRGIFVNIVKFIVITVRGKGKFIFKGGLGRRCMKGLGYSFFS